MQIEVVQRVFNYNGTQLQDICPEGTPEDVLRSYANLFPEITNGIIEGPDSIDGKMVYTITRAIGSKA